MRGTGGTIKRRKFGSQELLVYIKIFCENFEILCVLATSPLLWSNRYATGKTGTDIWRGHLLLLWRQPVEEGDERFPSRVRQIRGPPSVANQLTRLGNGRPCSCRVLATWCNSSHRIFVVVRSYERWSRKSEGKMRSMSTMEHLYTQARHNLKSPNT